VNAFHKLINQHKNLASIIRALKEHGARAYLVGGAVRDLVLGFATKDIDIEVHNIVPETLERVLKKFGSVILVGKQFGVFRLRDLDIDWSLPRTDSSGRKPEVSIDPIMGIERACRRRDVTMNAMAIELTALFEEAFKGKEDYTPQIIDPYGGLRDIERKVLRAVDETLFIQDPLRFYRVMQFVARFEMEPDVQLNDICRRMKLRDYATKGVIARERICEELKKLFLKSKEPSRGFRWLQKIGRLKDTFPALADLIGVPQRPDYHPEGDVFEHTMQSFDASAEVDDLIKAGLKESSSRYPFEKIKWLVMVAVLFHDLGKVVATETKEDGSIKSWGHDKEGEPLAEKMVKQFSNELWLLNAVKRLVRYHMEPSIYVQNDARLSKYKLLAAELAPRTNMWHLSMVYWCDLRGRNGEGSTPLEEPQQLPAAGGGYDVFVATTREAGVLYGREEPVLSGKDFLDVTKEGPFLGKILSEAYRIQLEEGERNPHILKKRLIKMFSK